MSSRPMPRESGFRVFFGHQSVGADLLLGLRELDANPAVHLQELTEGAHVPALDATGETQIVHARIGSNGDGATKVRHFIRLLERPDAGPTQLAVMKFCYVDVRDESQATRVWEEYESGVSYLDRTLPDIRLAHMTIPLRSIPSGPYAAMRQWIGGDHAEHLANRARCSFNERLRERFGGGLLFDLARFQSTRADGSPYTVRGRHGPTASLVPAYTDDGGHLNAAGRRAIASGFARFLHDARTRLS